MRRLLLLLAIGGTLAASAPVAIAQDDTTTAVASADTTAADTAAAVAATPDPEPTVTPDPALTAEPEEDLSFHQRFKEWFIDGDPFWMSLPLICLILGLAFVIERVIYLNLATTNNDKLVREVEDALNTGGIEAAQDVTRNTRGPVASIFHQGLLRVHEGPDMVEKTVVAYGGVQMGLLERGLTWISLFIALAPMLGFMGTVVGMIEAFDKIEMAGDVSPSLVAGGIKVALLTTLFGLVVAIILQVFYNYLVSKVDGIVNDMENASITLVDIITKRSNTNL